MTSHEPSEVRLLMRQYTILASRRLQKRRNRRAACPLPGQGEGSGNGHADGTKKITNSTPVSRLWVSIFRTPGFSARHAENDSITRIEVFAGHHTIESLQIIVTVPVLLDLLLCHSR